MSSRRSLLDEHVDPALRAQLVRHEPDLVVWIIGDPGAPRHGSPDADILLWCEANSFSLVTNNRDFIENERLYWRMREQLLKQYEGQWVAIEGGKVVASRERILGRDVLNQLDSLDSGADAIYRGLVHVGVNGQAQAAGGRGDQWR